MKITTEQQKWFIITKPINFLGIKTIGKDIKELPKTFKILLICIGIIVTFLSFFDFNHFIDANHNPSFFSIVNILNTPKPYLGNIPKWIDATLYSLSGLVSFTSILNVVLISFGKMSNYFWGLISVTTFGLFSFGFGYTGYAQLNLFFYLPFQFIGWYTWQKTFIFEQDSSLNIRNSKWLIILPISLGICAILAIAWYYEIPAFHYALVKTDYAYLNQPIAHIFDSTINSIAIIASILMFLRLKEQWILWLISNILQFAMFVGVNSIGANYPITININMLIQTSFFIANSIIGFLVWGGYLNKIKSG
ncbi:nicotinamide riboside transporter PnuC [Spiroplasma phoeniceum]|uniref:Nicotinamide mononucleotide transporter PnuC n=1 Tax=Spiroplasma phoeniceum P40 TaxID=1276259 RepID=A0A345DRK1_9MOLU|nr:nicotinamide riboside transporter PnuC [Spiroplasma phoeniceum]AXF96842.1 nicotinamide mononucleotide transporter PnuC [Spiroplasma phoeniceum P40]